MVKLYLSLLSLAATAKDRLRHDEEGATAVEYGLMVALIAAGIITIVMALRDQLNVVFGDVVTGLRSI